MRLEDEATTKDSPLRSKVLCYGFLHCLYRIDGQYVIGGRLQHMHSCVAPRNTQGVQLALACGLMPPVAR